MLEKRNKRLLIQLLVLLAGTFAIYWLRRKDERYQPDKNLFKSAKFQSIDKITLESESARVALTFNGSRWKVNDQYNADPAMIDLLFATLQQAEPKRPVAESLQDSIHKSLNDNGVHVSLLSKGSIDQEFQVGGNESKSQTYFEKTGSMQPYLVTIPGYRVYVAGIFDIDESGWRDKYVFGFNWRNFKKLQITFPKSNSKFSVSMGSEYFTIPEITAVDTTKLNNFLDEVSLLMVDQYIPTDSTLDSLKQTPFITTFEVQDIGSRIYRLRIFKRQNDNFFVGIIDDQQWATFSAAKIVPLIKPKEFFIKR